MIYVPGTFSEPLRPGRDHCFFLGPDCWTAPDYWRAPECEWSVNVPLEPQCISPPNWDGFHLVSPDFRAACVQLCGVAPRDWQPPVILPCWSWIQSEYLGMPLWRERLGDTPLPGVETGHGRLWALQRTYMGVTTFLLEPGYLVRTDGFRMRVLEDISPDDWLAGELECWDKPRPQHVLDRASYERNDG